MCRNATSRLGNATKLHG
ncbi:hypothetical protein A2U01_0063126, partial [Trifolium medium]|nr:hypothetical protein [Trifolium medium]